MTKDEFIKQYCDRSNVSWARLQQRRVVLECACGESRCEGWAMVTNEPDAIEAHMHLYSGKQS